jgi:hypothetical protein
VGTSIVLVSVALSACSAEQAELVVELKTDYVPRTDFWVARTELSRTPFADGPTDVRTETAIAETGVDYLAGRRIAELGEVEPGTVYLRVALLDASDAEVARRSIVVDVAGPTAVTVLVSASCSGIVCPNDPSFPERTECAGGRCVDPRCSETTPDFCGESRCTADADCSATVACARGTCVGGECFATPDDGACASGEVCSLARGCVPLTMPGADGGPPPPPMDGGPPACVRTGPEDMGPVCQDGTDNDCDGFVDCADNDCRARVCVAGMNDFRCCGGTCVDTNTDEQNCGSCGAVCTAGEECRSGPDDHGRCQCARDADCPSRGQWSCVSLGGTTRCDCLGDGACGADFVCIMPAGEHSYCRASF